MGGRKAIDCGGKIFGSHRVVGRVEGKDKKNSYWECECVNCGNRQVMAGSKLMLQGAVGKSCWSCRGDYRTYPVVEQPCVVCEAPIVVQSNVKRNRTCSPECKAVLRSEHWSRNRYETVEKFLHALLLHIRSRAKRKEMEFDIEDGHLMKLYAEQEGRCKATGVEFGVREEKVGKSRANKDCPSVDRVDPSRGYTMDNIELVSFIYNTAKNAFTVEEFTEMCKSYLSTKGFDCIPKEGIGQ